jgi:N-acetylglucosamine malate deacetylase 1
MKRTPKSDPSTSNVPTLLAFGAHPDDIEFACGAIIAKETGEGRRAHFVVCSKGESATHGTPAQRKREAEKSAAILGATVEFVELDGDAHLDVRVSHALRLAKIIRQVRPNILLAPSLVGNQHPDHAKLGSLVRDAARLARYGGVAELRRLKPHAISQLFFYAITPDAEPADLSPVLIDVSEQVVMDAWTNAMQAHASQTNSRSYVELQIARARLNGLRSGVGHAIALYPCDPPLLDSLEHLGRSARGF